MIYKTPQLPGPDDVASYLKIHYDRVIEIPADILPRKALQIVDEGIYSELVDDGFGGYIEVNYKIDINPDDGSEYRTAI